MVGKNIDIFMKYNPFKTIPTKNYFHTQGDACDILRYDLTIAKQLFSC